MEKEEKKTTEGLVLPEKPTPQEYENMGVVIHELIKLSRNLNTSYIPLTISDGEKEYHITSTELDERVVNGEKEIFCNVKIEQKE